MVFQFPFFLGFDFSSPAFPSSRSSSSSSECCSPYCVFSRDDASPRSSPRPRRCSPSSRSGVSRCPSPDSICSVVSGVSLSFGSLCLPLCGRVAPGSARATPPPPPRAASLGPPAAPSSSASSIIIYKYKVNKESINIFILNSYPINHTFFHNFGSLSLVFG